jgi:hypothetical protein
LIPTKWLAFALWLVGAACASGAASARSAFEARCEALGPTVVVVTAGDAGYRVDNTRSWQQLAQLKRSATPNTYVLGLTRAETRVSGAANGSMLQDPSGRAECGAPRIEVALHYEPMVVYIGSELAPGSCAYREVLAHEMRHLNTYLDHLRKVEATVRAALASRFAGKPLYGPAGQAGPQLQRELDGRWAEFIRNELAKVEPLQAAIDTPQEYGRLSEVCGGEVQSLIRLSKRRTNS